MGCDSICNSCTITFFFFTLVHVATRNQLEILFLVPVSLRITMAWIHYLWDSRYTKLFYVACIFACILKLREQLCFLLPLANISVDPWTAIGKGLREGEMASEMNGRLTYLGNTARGKKPFKW